MLLTMNIVGKAIWAISTIQTELRSLLKPHYVKMTGAFLFLFEHSENRSSMRELRANNRPYYGNIMKRRNLYEKVI